MLAILHQSYWRDEAFSVLISAHNLRDIFWLTLKDTHPPLYYFLLHFWTQFFGNTEYVTRSLSLLSHVILVVVCFFILNHLIKNWKVSIMGSLAVFFNPFLLEYAFEARSYLFFGLLIATTTLLYLKKRFFLTSIFLTLALLTHNFAVFFFAGFLAHWLVVNYQLLKQKIWQSVALFALPVLGFLGWLQILWNQWVKVAEDFWITTQSSSIFINAFRHFFQGSLDYPSKAMLYNLTLVLVFLAGSFWLINTTRTEQEKSPDQSSILVYLFSLPFLAVYIISAFWVPIYHERFLLPLLPMFIVWVAYSIYRLSKTKQSLSHIVFAFSIAFLLFNLQADEEILSKTTKPAINYGVSQVLAQAKEGDIIIPESNLNFLEVKHYVQRSGMKIPVYAYSKNGLDGIPFYIGKALFNNEDIISQYPEHTNIWIVTPDGGNYLKDSL